MSFKDILSKLDQLSEAETKDTETGRVHKGDYGTSYGKEDVRDQYGHRVGKVDKEAGAKKDQPKKGRGRPKKGADDSGEVKKYDASALGAAFGGGKKPSKPVGKTSVKHSLKEYFDEIDARVMNEAEQLSIEPAKQDTQVIKQGTKTLGTVSNPQLAAQIKQSIGKGEMTLTGDELGEGSDEKWIQKAVKHPGAFTAKAKAAGKSVAAFAKEKEHAPGKLGKQARLAMTLKKMHEEIIDEELTSVGMSDQRAAKLIMDKIKGLPMRNIQDIERNVTRYLDMVGKAPTDVKHLSVLIYRYLEDLGLMETMAKMDEADLPPQDGLMGAGLGAGRSQGVTEAAKPDFLDLDKDGNKKESMKKAVQDKKKVKEGMEHRLKAAHHRGKAHALAKESYNCKYDDMEEARMYHEGFKEGLDECYGQVPIRGLVTKEGGAQGTVDDMASFGARTPAMEDDMEEGNAFTAALAKTPRGGKFSVGGKTFTDRTNYDAKVDEMDSVFESWDNQLDSLLEEYQDIQEGMTVSISKGQQGSPDSVSVTAQDGEADKLLALVKSAGLGLFGDEQQADVGVPVGAHQHGGVDVVGDHDGMMALMKKMSGGQPGMLEPADSQDYKDEEGSEDEGGLDIIKQLTQKLGGHEHGPEKHEEDTCNECGMMEAECECTKEEQVDEVESEDQQEYQVAEDNPPDTGAAEFQAMDQEIAQDNAAASSHGGAQNSNLEEENEEPMAGSEGDSGDADTSTAATDAELAEDDKELEESYANADDDKFEADIDFMTKVISGGLNKQKSTGQTTIPVIAGQDDRMGYSVNESALTDWKKLAGI